MASAEGAGGIRQCYIDIAKVDTTGDYDRALKAANRLLKKFPKEGRYAFKCKLVALIQLGMYDDALILIKKTSSHDMGPVHFEKAYIHYRLNENDQALEELAKGKDEMRVKELKAQILYRLGRMEEAYELYKDLLKNESDDNDQERKANMIAVEAQLASHGKNTVSIVDSLDTFEQLYNASCIDIEKDQFSQALKKLDKAIPLAREALTEDGLNDEEIEEENASLTLQRAFILHKMGKIDEAYDIYEKIESIKPNDKSVMASVLNNLASVSHRNNLNDARKKLKAATQIDTSKLSRHQRVTLLFNQALVLLLSNQREPSKRVLDQLVTEYGSWREVELTEAALHWKAKDADKAVAALPSKDPLSILARVHILVNLGKMDEALNELSSLPEDVRSKVGIVSLKAAILEAKGDVDGSVNTINNAKKGWKGDEASRALDSLAELETKRGKYDEAAIHLEQLYKNDSSNIGVISRLIRAYSYCEPGKADTLREKAFPEGKNDSIDVDVLEESDWILYGKKYNKKEAKDGVTQDDTEIVTGKLHKRKRKRTILPKNFDPNVQPDPERWLPKEERSAYKKKRKNREREVGRGTQGSAAAPSIEYKGADPTSSPRPIPTEGPRQQIKNQQKKKKAKGGNKW